MTDTSNPFNDATAVEESNYCRFDGKHLVCAGAHASPMSAFVHDNVRALVLNERFSCVAAKAAIRQNGYVFGLYGELGSPAGSAGLARDLFTFCRERNAFPADFTTFVASFAGPTPADEATFERFLWTTLQQLHERDAEHHQWDHRVEADASHPDFSFSFAETAFFVVGLHAASSRATRRFAWPTLIFNPHDQFERLRHTGRYGRFQRVIRAAERLLQGNINPMLANFGERSEASQYSGRRVGRDWKCPFHVRASRAPEQENEP